MNEVDKLDKQNENSKSEFNLFDIIFLAWEYKFRYLAIASIIFFGVFLSLGDNSQTKYNLSIVISDPEPPEINELINFEAKCNIYFIEDECGLLTSKKLHLSMLNLIQMDKKKSILIEEILSEKLSSIESENLSEALAVSLTSSRVNDLGGELVENLTEINVIHENIELLDLLSNYLLFYLEKSTINNILNHYQTKLNKIELSSEYLLEKNQKEIALLETLASQEMIVIDESAVSTDDKKLIPYYIIIKKKLEINEIENMNIVKFKELIRSNSLLNKEQTYHSVQSISIDSISSNLNLRKNILIAFMVTIVISALILALQLEIKQRKLN